MNAAGWFPRVMSAGSKAHQMSVAPLRCHAQYRAVVIKQPPSYRHVMIMSV